MKNKKNFRVSYNSGDGIIEITIKDHTGRRMDRFVMNQRDSKSHKLVGETLKDKYGIDMCPIKREVPTGIFDF